MADPGGTKGTPSLKVDRFTKTVVLLNGAVPVAPPRLGRLGRPARGQPGQLRHPHDRDPRAHLPRAVAGRHARRAGSPAGAGSASSGGCSGSTPSSTPRCTSCSSSGSTAPASVGDTASEILKRPYLMVGMVGLVLMVPLAATSTNGMIRRLGPARWKALHRLAYVAAAAGSLHFYMLVKADVTRPVAFAAALGLLFLYRLVAHYRQLRVGRPEVPRPPRPPPRPGAAEALGRAAAGRPGLRRDARGPHVPPRVARRATRCRSTSSPAST